MRTKQRTIILAKIRRQLRKLARRNYDEIYGGIMENDIQKIAVKVYELMEGIKNVKCNK